MRIVFAMPFCGVKPSARGAENADLPRGPSEIKFVPAARPAILPPAHLPKHSGSQLTMDFLLIAFFIPSCQFGTFDITATSCTYK
jgi:hypothetical protein